MKRLIARLMIVVLAWGYIIPLQAMFTPVSTKYQKKLQQQAQSQQHLKRPTGAGVFLETPSASSSSSSSFSEDEYKEDIPAQQDSFSPQSGLKYESEIMEPGKYMVEETTKSPEPAPTPSERQEQPSMFSQGWQALQQRAAAVQQRISGALSSAANRVQQGTTVVQQQLISMINDVKEWSYSRILRTLFAIALAYGLIITLESAGPSNVLDRLKNDSSYGASLILSGAALIITPFGLRAGDINTVRTEADNISAQVRRFPLSEQAQAINDAVQNWAHQPKNFMKSPLQSKILAAAQIDLIKRMKEAMIVAAKYLSPDQQREELEGLYEHYSNHNNNDELARQAYNEALEELGLMPKDISN